MFSFAMSPARVPRPVRKNFQTRPMHLFFTINLTHKLKTLWGSL